MKKERDLTSGNITSGLWAFAVPLMLGNVIQQFYNLADTWIVGRYIGNIGLAAVGSSYTLMTFLTYIIIDFALETVHLFLWNMEKRILKRLEMAFTFLLL